MKNNNNNNREKKNLVQKRGMGYCPTVLQGESFVLQYIQCIASWKGLLRLRKGIAAGLEGLVAIQILYCRQLVGEIILQYIKMYCSKGGWLERSWVTIQFCIMTWEGQWAGRLCHDTTFVS